MDTVLRIYAGTVVTESDLTKSSKLQLLNFIQNEATDAQIKALLMDGEVVQLDEQSEEIVNTRFEISEAGGRVATARKTQMSLAGAHSGYGIPWAVYRMVRANYDVCTRRCGKFELNTARRQVCMAKCRIEKYQKQYDAAKKAGVGKEVLKKQKQLDKAKTAYDRYQKAFKKRKSNINNA